MWQLLSPTTLELIFMILRDGSETTSLGRVQLSRLSRVCKSWSMIALKLLWASCDDFSRLLSALSDDILLHLRENAGETQELQTTIPHADLGRFSMYAHQIRDLMYDHRTIGTAFQLTSATMLQICSQMKRPFINLRRLHFTSFDSKGWYIIPYLLGPTTTHLVLDVRSDVVDQQLVQHLATMKEALSDVINVAPNLRTLVIKIEKEHELLFGVLSRFIVGLRILRKIQVPLGGPSLPSTLYHLSSSAHLVVADLNIYPGSLDVDQLRFPPGAFPSLRTLNFSSKISIYLPLIHSIQLSTLNSVQLTFHEHSPCPTETFHTLIQATCRATSSLQVFELKIVAPTSHRQLSNLPTAAVLLPLFAHRKLEELVIDLGVPIQLNDADIDTISHMWPYCRKLRLTPLDAQQRSLESAGWTSKVTPRGIIALLYHLVNLKELAIEFDATSLDVVGTEGPVSEPYLPYRQVGSDGHLQARKTSSLEILDVGRSVAADPLKVASWIGVLCPRLKELKWTGDSEAWARARLVLQKIQRLYESNEL
ncbi:hypothetical protein FRC18_007654 [Serendipita sp. 400]|nr:hypothetical protein FRC18_007654 [Serendipita sp. 400]